MNAIVPFIIGLIVGWLLEWAIDFLYWRQKTQKAEARASELERKLKDMEDQHAIELASVWEMDPYFRLAESWGYRVFSIIVENRHNVINQHNVPDEKRVIMKERFEIKLI